MARRYAWSFTPPAQDLHVHMDVARMATAAEKIGAELAKVTLNPKYAEWLTKV